MKRLITIAAAPMIAGALTLGASDAASASTASTASVSASAGTDTSIVGDPGVYLSSTPTLTLAAPNVVVPGKAAVLKTCNSVLPGNCATLVNDKGTERFDFVPSTNVFHPGTFEIRLGGTPWCLTSRSFVSPARVFFETCSQFASQLWLPTIGVIVNARTHLHLGHTAVQPYAPLEADTTLTHWGNSS